MPKLEDATPKFLQPYIAHGVHLDWRDNNVEANGDCPYCGRGEKFFVNKENGKNHCKKCGESGNVPLFIRWLWKESYEKTLDYSELKKNRNFKYDETLREWEVCRSILNKEWLIPGYAEDGRLMQLYRRSQITRKEEWVYILKPTATLGHHLHGVNLYDKKKEIVFLCEGGWDGMAFYEVLGRCKDETYTPIGNRSKSLLANANVLATPGCNVFQDRWIPLFADKIVCLLYDNDYPKVNPKTNKVVPPAGLAGMQRVAGILGSATTPPKEIHYLSWGNEGSTKDLDDGMDMRDYFNRAEILSA